jgi:hypothetical protein
MLTNALKKGTIDCGASNGFPWLDHLETLWAYGSSRFDLKEVIEEGVTRQIFTEPNQQGTFDDFLSTLIAVLENTKVANDSSSDASSPLPRLSEDRRFDWMLARHHDPMAWVSYATDDSRLMQNASSTANTEDFDRNSDGRLSSIVEDKDEDELKLPVLKRDSGTYNAIVATPIESPNRSAGSSLAPSNRLEAPVGIHGSDQQSMLDSEGEQTNTDCGIFLLAEEPSLSPRSSTSGRLCIDNLNPSSACSHA